MGSKKSANERSPDDIDFIGGIGHKENDKVFKKSKNVFDSREQELFPSRAPVHSGSSTNKTKPGQRGNSPATGALAGVPQSETAPIPSSSSESKS